MLGQITDQALNGLVLHHTDTEVSGVLQSRGKEVDATNRSAQKLDVDLTKVMLTKFPRKAFEADQRFDSFGAQGAHQSI